MEAETNRIKCDYCKKDIVIPYDGDDNAGGLMHVSFSENMVMLVLLCLSCGGINDLFYDFRESQCEDHVGKEPPWKNDEGYKEGVQIQEMTHFILFNREITESGLL